MNSRRLTLLSLVALIVIAGAVWIGFARKPSAELSAALYPALKGQLSKVTAVQIFQSSDQPIVEATRTETGWHLRQRNGYAADAGKINALLLNLESAKLREEKTSNPANYEILGVQDKGVQDKGFQDKAVQDVAAASAAPNTTPTRVQLVGVEPAVNLIVGKQDATGRASYVRRAGEAKSWLISELIVVPSDITSWLHRDLLNISADRIQEVVVQVSGNPRYSVVKAKRTDANFDVALLPKGRELNSVSAANAVAQTLVNLQLDDVRPLSELSNAKSVAQTAVHTFDGLVVDVLGYSIDGKQWITVKVSFDEALAKQFQTQPDAIDKVRAEADALNKQRGDWAYAIATYKYEAIFKPLESLLRKK